MINGVIKKQNIKNEFDQNQPQKTEVKLGARQSTNLYTSLLVQYIVHAMLLVTGGIFYTEILLVFVYYNQYASIYGFFQVCTWKERTHSI